MLIGILGNIRSGKSTVARILEQRYGFVHVSTNEELTRHIESKGFSNLSRVDRFKHAQELRETTNPGILVQRALDEAKKLKAPHLVLTGIYVENEARVLLNSKGFGSTHLVLIETQDKEARWSRLMSSVRGSRDYLTREEFDSFGTESSPGPKLDSLVEQLKNDVRKLPNDRGIHELIAEVNRLIESLDHGDELQILRDDLDLAVKHEPALDDYSNVIDLERRYRIGEILKSFLRSSDETGFDIVWDHYPKHRVRELGNQFLRRLTQCFLEQDYDVAFRRYTDLDVYTVNEEMASLLNAEEFGVCHAQIHEYLREKKRDIHETVINNLRGSFADHDETQKSTTVKRSLASLVEHGINCDIALVETQGQNSWDCLERAREASARGDLPILEYIKRDRILTIQGLNEASKVSLAIHDAVDHLWFTNLLSEAEDGDESILDRHSELLRSIGDPVHFDLFRRESEMIASIAFGVRYWASQQIGFVPRVSFDEIRSVFERAIASDRFVDKHHLHAYRTVLRLAEKPRQKEVQSLEFSFSNYVTELDEQRRKHGEIKVFGAPITKPVGKLDPWGIDYVSFFVDAHHKITRSKSFHRDTLFKVHVMLEDWLTSVQRTAPTPLLLQIGTIARFDASMSTVSVEKRRWMEANFGFTSYKEPLF